MEDLCSDILKYISEFCNFNDTLNLSMVCKEYYVKIDYFLKDKINVLTLQDALMFQSYDLYIRMYNLSECEYKRKLLENRFNEYEITDSSVIDLLLLEECSTETINKIIDIGYYLRIISDVEAKLIVDNSYLKFPSGTSSEDCTTMLLKINNRIFNSQKIFEYKYSVVYGDIITYLSDVIRNGNDHLFNVLMTKPLYDTKTCAFIECIGAFIEWNAKILETVHIGSIEIFKVLREYINVKQSIENFVIKNIALLPLHKDLIPSYARKNYLISLIDGLRYNLMYCKYYQDEILEMIDVAEIDVIFNSNSVECIKHRINHEGRVNIINEPDESIIKFMLQHCKAKCETLTYILQSYPHLIKLYLQRYPIYTSRRNEIVCKIANNYNYRCNIEDPYNNHWGDSNGIEQNWNDYSKNNSMLHNNDVEQNWTTYKAIEYVIDSSNIEDNMLISMLFKVYNEDLCVKIIKKIKVLQFNKVQADKFKYITRKRILYLLLKHDIQNFEQQLKDDWYDFESIEMIAKYGSSKNAKIALQYLMYHIIEQEDYSTLMSNFNFIIHHQIKIPEIPKNLFHNELEKQLLFLKSIL